MTALAMLMLRCSLIIIIISPPRGNKLRISYCLPKQTLRQSASRDKQNMENEEKKEWKWFMCAPAGARAISAAGERD